MRLLFVALLLSGGMVGRAHAEGKPSKRPPTVQAQGADACVEARGGVRVEAYGYTHVVTLKNGCAKPVECSVWTDVDPEPRAVVQADAGETVEVVTRRGSPAREVAAFKSCRYR